MRDQRDPKKEEETHRINACFVLLCFYCLSNLSDEFDDVCNMNNNLRKLKRNEQSFSLCSCRNSLIRRVLICHLCVSPFD